MMRLMYGQRRAARAACCLTMAASVLGSTVTCVQAHVLQGPTTQAPAPPHMTSTQSAIEKGGSPGEGSGFFREQSGPIDMRAFKSRFDNWPPLEHLGQLQTPGQQAGGPAGPISLSLQQAIQLALNNNLQALLARERREEARGLSEQSRAALLPNLSGSVIQQELTRNLAAEGFQPGLFPGLTSSLIGPFRFFDARATLVQSLFNLSSIRQFQASRINTGIAGLQIQLANQQVAQQTALAYLNALSAERAVVAAQANLDLARSLLKLAQDQHTAGVATGVDVTRAETRAAGEQVRVAQAQTDAQTARFDLLRIVGLPIASRLTLTETLRFIAEPFPAADAIVAEAERDRMEIRIAGEQVQLANRTRQAAEAEQLPSIDFLGDYGESGNTPRENALPTRSIGVRVNVPLFNGGLTRGRIRVASSRKRQAELQLKDVRAQVEEDVRLALANLETAAQQVNAAQLSVQLAERELQMSRDRFVAGLTSNIEVVNAQTALANARQAEVTALTQYNAFRINLAAARGRIESFRW